MTGERLTAEGPSEEEQDQAEEEAMLALENALLDLVVDPRLAWWIAKLFATEKGEWVNINQAFREAGEEPEPGVPDTAYALWAPYGTGELRGEEYEVVTVVLYDAETLFSTVAQLNKDAWLEKASELAAEKTAPKS